MVLQFLLNIIAKYSVVLFALFFSLFAHANETNKTVLGERAIQTALQLEVVAQRNSDVDFRPSNSANSDTEKHQYSRLQILNGFDSTSTNEFLDVIASYQQYATQAGDEMDIELAVFFKDLSEIYNPYSVELSTRSDAALAFLNTHLNSENWHIKHSATILTAVLNSYRRDITQALELASKSFTIIPEDDSFASQVARLYSYELTTYLHGVLKNPDIYISSIDGLVLAAEKIGHPIESVNYLNNLIYSLKGLEINPKITRELVQILLRVGEKHPSDTPGLVEMRAANALIRIGDFKEALPIALRGLAASENDMISNYLKIAEIQSLAATGESEQAEAQLTAFQNALSASETDTSFADSEVFKAKGLIAMARGDANETFINMDRHAELTIQRLLRSNNTDTSNLLANLENDKARQAEREAAREEMFRLEEEALTQKINASQRGLAIMVLLAIAAVLTAAFMTYRSRVALKLAQSAEAALAGEIAKTQFLAVISHELRTPLNGIIGIADLLSRTAPTDKLRQQINIINHSGQDLLSLVEQILDMSRIDANEMEVFPESSDIRAIITSIDDLWRPTIEANDVTFTSHVDSSVPQNLMLDPMRLRQCVNNLVSNAAKFTKQGRVHMHVTATPNDDDMSATLTVIVADTGMGIRAEVQDNLFRPFVQADSSVTRQYGGSGLGLAISRSLARIMGGDLTVSSRQNAGSEFTLTLRVEQTEDVGLLDTMETIFSEIDETTPSEIPPTVLDVSPNSLAADKLETQPMHQSPDIIEVTDIEIETPTPPAMTAQPDFDSLDKVRVLIVEDIISNQDVMKIFLEPEGCEIMCADNGVQALEALQSQDFDVVLMDIRMPEMDGIEATRLIRDKSSRNYAVPIIALTADATAETNAQCMAAGANIFLTKPIIATELFDSIRFVRRQAFNRAEAQQAEKETAQEIRQISA